MATDARGHTVPAATDAPKRADLTSLSLSIRDIVYVASVADRGTKVGALSPSATNPVYTYRADAPSGMNLEVTTNGTTWAAVQGGDTGWINLTPNTGWTATAGYLPAYRIIGGIVYVTGMVTRGTSPAAALVTLPAAATPSRSMMLPERLTSSGVGYNLFVQTTGDMGFSTGYTTGTTTSGSAHPLDCSFPLG